MTWLIPMRGMRMSPMGWPSAGSDVREAVTGGPFGSLSRAVAWAKAWTISWLFVSERRVPRSAFWVCDSWIAVPQIWYAVNKSRRIPAPIRIFPVMEAVRRSIKKRLGPAGYGHPVTPQLTPELLAAYACTVTRVPRGVNGYTTAALEIGISTQPSLWGYP